MTAAPSVGTLADWLLVQVAEDEAVARAAVLPASDIPPDQHGYRVDHPALAHWRSSDDDTIEWEWDYDDGRNYGATFPVACPGGELWEGGVDSRCTVHITRWDPARVLAECAAKRAIVEAYSGAVFARDCHPEDPAEAAHVRGVERAILALATVYVDRPGFREEWR